MKKIMKNMDKKKKLKKNKNISMIKKIHPKDQNRSNPIQIPTKIFQLKKN